MSSLKKGQNRFVFFLLSFLFSCASAPIMTGDGLVEPSLAEVSGVSSELLREARKKPEWNLFDLYAMAVESSDKLAIRYEKVRQAEAKKGLAFSMFLPTLSYRNQKSEFYPNPAEKQETERNKQYAYSALGVPNAYLPLVNSTGSTSGTSLTPALRSGQRLVLHVPIFTGLSEYSAYVTAKSEIRVRKLEMSQEALLLLTDLSQAYYTILLLEKSLIHKNEIQKLTKDLIVEYKRRVNLGQARNSELASIQARLATYEAEIFSIREQIKAGKEKISYLCNVTGESKLKDDILVKEPEFSLHEAVEKLEERVDVRTAKATLGLANEKVIAAKGGLLPNVFIDAQYNIAQGNTKSSVFAQFVFEIPLFSGGKTIFAISEADSIKKEAELFLKNTIRSGIDEIRRTYSAYRMGINEVDAYKNALDSSERSHRLMQKDFRNKIVNSLELLNSLTSLAQAKESYERAYLQNKLNRVLLGIVTGELPTGAKHWKNEEKKDPEKKK